MDTLRDELDRLADKAQAKADLARKNSEKYKRTASFHAEIKDFALAEVDRKAAAGYLNDYFYWKGQAVALHGVAAGLGLRKVVEEEMDGEARCP